MSKTKIGNRLFIIPSALSVSFPHQLSVLKRLCLVPGAQLRRMDSIGAGRKQVNHLFNYNINYRVNQGGNRHTIEPGIHMRTIAIKNRFVRVCILASRR